MKEYLPLSRRKFTDILRFVAGYIIERPTLDEPIDAAAEGSSNVLFMGQGEPTPFKGVEDQSEIGGVYHVGRFGITDIAP